MLIFTIKFLIWIGLVVASVYLVHGYWSKYIAQKTTMAASRDDRSEKGLILPSMTLCFDPPFRNKEMSEKLKIGEGIFAIIYEDYPTDLATKSLLSYWRDSTYQLHPGVLTLKWDGIELELGANDKVNVLVREINTYKHGVCYSLSKTELYTIDSKIAIIEIILGNNLPQLPSTLKVFLHEPDDWFGAFTGEWPGSRPLVDDATLDQNIHISLEQEEMSLVPDLNVGKCIQDGISREECFWQTHIDMLLNPPESLLIREAEIPTTFKHCMIPQIKTMFDHFNESLDECTNADDAIVMSLLQDPTSPQAKPRHYKSCLPSCKTTFYGGMVTKTDFLFQSNETKVHLGFRTLQVEHQEETLIYDSNDIMAAVGGSLGLFLGFCFWDLFVEIIDKLSDFFKNRGKTKLIDLEKR